jgi:hypothetical protein
LTSAKIAEENQTNEQISTAIAQKYQKRLHETKQTTTLEEGDSVIGSLRVGKSPPLFAEITNYT